jgi:demethylmenaquinone methyltransferase/2-methoxy-6-polyprenyl-1,4-benzoquinol methylase
MARPDAAGGRGRGDPPAAPVDKQPARIAGMFDAIARRYDLLNHLLSGGLDWYWRRRAVRALGLAGDETVLDLCTGTADLAIAVLRHRRGCRVVGVDFAARMLAIGRDKLQRRGLAARAALVRGDATRIPLASGTCGAAAVAFGIRNVVEPEAACQELARILRPGGRLAILEFSMPRSRLIAPVYAWYFRHVLPRIGRLVSRHREAYAYLPRSVGAFATPEELAAIVEAAGLRVVRMVPLTLGVVYLYVAVKDGARSGGGLLY